MESFKDYFNFDEINKEFTTIINYSGMSILEIVNTIENFDNIKADYENSIQIREIIEKFNELYTEFMKDLTGLEKLHIAREVDILEYYEKSFGINKTDRYLKLFLYLTTLKKDRNSRVLIISEKDEEINLMLKNSRYGYDVTKVNMTERRKELFKKYLDLFSKHNELIKMYTNLRYDNGYRTSCLNDGFTCGIDLDLDEYWDMYDGLKEVYFHIRIKGNSIMIPFKLGDNLKIDYENCDFSDENDEYIKMPNKAYDELINEIYINKECLTKRGISLDNGFQRKKH